MASAIDSGSSSKGARHTARCRGFGVDPIVHRRTGGARLQTVVSRQVDITKEPAVRHDRMIKGGVRENIIPDSVEMRGTIRTFDEEMRDDVHERVKYLAEAISRGSHAGCQGQYSGAITR